MTPRARDAADRWLGLVIRLLPASRAQWGHAMRAELAALENAADRRRFALSCTRVALVPTAGPRLGVASLVLVAAVALAGVIGPAIPALASLAALAWLGRRPGAFGPVRRGRVARAVRAGGLALPCAIVLIDALQDGVPGLLQPDHHGRLVTLVLAFLAAAFLAVSADGSRLGDDVLAAGAIAGLVAGAARVRASCRSRRTPPRSRAGCPGAGSWLALVVFGAPLEPPGPSGTRALRSSGRRGGALLGDLRGVRRRAAGTGRDRALPRPDPASRRADDDARRERSGTSSRGCDRRFGSRRRVLLLGVPRAGEPVGQWPVRQVPPQTTRAARSS